MRAKRAWGMREGVRFTHLRDVFIGKNTLCKLNKQKQGVGRAILDEAEYAVLKNLAYGASSNGKANSSFLLEV